MMIRQCRHITLVNVDRPAIVDVWINPLPKFLRKRQKICMMNATSVEVSSLKENSPETLQSAQEPLPGCSRDHDFAGSFYQNNGDSVDGSLLSEELELLIPGREFFLMEKRRTLYKRVADLYESLKLEDAEEKKKKKSTTQISNKNLSIG
ncbi:hypothetical protein KQX54_014077 [Cotesia glomerata]|uniref:Uncharacterized protein n=1 Tax=Cotesia glomerata TaxID=32391 RepID=A0AAV7IT37_COTGL|nr:hypothetical protein KQX54_014077 [Cotesia glomerata]